MRLRIVGSRAMTAENAHDGDLFERKQAGQAFLRHRVAADAAEAHALGSEPRLERAHQLGTELVARFLARHDPDRQRLCVSQ